MRRGVRSSFSRPMHTLRPVTIPPTGALISFSSSPPMCARNSGHLRLHRPECCCFEAHCAHCVDLAVALPLISKRDTAPSVMTFHFDASHVNFKFEAGQWADFYLTDEVRDATHLETKGRLATCLSRDPLVSLLTSYPRAAQPSEAP